MLFEPTGLAGAWLIKTEQRKDVRGHFARVYCKNEFEAHGMSRPLVQASLSFNRKRGTVRGMHFQWPPSREDKLIRCVRGAIFDVIIDLRPESSSFMRHFGAELSADNEVSLYVPDGFAHGFQSLLDDSELLYQMTDFYSAELGAGYRFDDPAFRISWPEPVTEISDRDRTAAGFDIASHVSEYRRRSAAGAT